MTINCGCCGNPLKPEQEASYLAEQEKNRLWVEARNAWAEHYPDQETRPPRQRSSIDILGIFGLLVLIGGMITLLKDGPDIDVGAIGWCFAGGFIVVAEILFINLSNWKEHRDFESAKAKFKDESPDRFKILFNG